LGKDESVTEPRDAHIDEAEVVGNIAAVSFFDDPVMGWAFPDPSARLAQLKVVFGGLVRDYLHDRGTVHVLEDVCVAFWRGPDFVHGEPPPEGVGGDLDDFAAFPPDVLERLVIMDQAMNDNHPHDRHWYLNVLGTLPARQGQGLGGATMAPVLATCDTGGIPAYLESSNPRNMSLYRRHGFEQTGEIPLPDGPSMYPMWREPRT
jgi:GNAT superfamily N-acetyltransferase